MRDRRDTDNNGRRMNRGENLMKKRPGLFHQKKGDTKATLILYILYIYICIYNAIKIKSYKWPLLNILRKKI